jgi:hypothetical protein
MTSFLHFRTPSLDKSYQYLILYPESYLLEEISCYSVKHNIIFYTS